MVLFVIGHARHIMAFAWRWRINVRDAMTEEEPPGWQPRMRPRLATVPAGTVRLTAMSENSY